MADARIPSDAVDLFTGKALAHLATITETGRPTVTPIWIDLEGGNVLVNSAKGRVKNRVMEVGAKVAHSIVDPDNSYRFLRLQGVVTERRDAGADEQLERLSQRYLGKAYPWRRPGEQRELFVIRPTHVRTMGPAQFPGTGKQ
ncbi:MAG TPA: TIGR03618 family F420-dependent PPOX class oxidoreductase [bacterium]